jgi:ABC-type nitrate/sulfonate/bicarbonate transport system permease component
MRFSIPVKARILQVVALSLFFGAWLYLQGPGDVSKLILPVLSQVVREFFGFLTSSELYRHARITFVEMSVAFSIAAVTGLAVGFWGARSQLRARVLEPLLVWGYLVPTILFYPLFLLWFGFGMSSKIGYGAVSAFFPIAFNSLRGFARVDERYVKVGRAYGASARQLDLLIKFRAGLPMAAAGVKIGAALTMITVIVAEMLGAHQGLGYLIQFYSQSFAPARTYAVIAVVLLIVGIFYVVMNRLLREEAPRSVI